MATPTIIDTPEGPIPIPIGVPQEAPHIHIPRAAGNYTWGDVFGWVHGTVSAAWAVLDWGSSGIESVVENAISQGLSTLQTALSGFTNLSFDMIDTLGTEVFDTIDGVQSYAIDVVLGIEARLFDVEAAIDYIANWIQGGAIDALQMEVDGIQGVIDNMPSLIERWAIDNVYNPLLDDIQTVDRTIIDNVAGVEDWVRSYIDSLDLGDIANMLTRLGLIGAAITAITTWIEECGEPTCEIAGPNSDWGKWLKRFGPLALWAMLAAVAAEDPQAIERLAAELGDTLGPVLSAWVKDWALGGGGFPSQPGDVSGAIGGNPLGI